jgi:aspartate/methionine/tyrosine aminotransferase
MVVARQVGAVARALRPFLEVVTQSPVQGARPVIADFMAGNPQEPTLPGFVEALRRWSVPASTDWFAYRLMHEPARQAAAASLTAELGVCFAAEDVFLTRGAAGAITLALSTVADPGDEVVFRRSQLPQPRPLPPVLDARSHLQQEHAGAGATARFPGVGARPAGC